MIRAIAVVLTIVGAVTISASIAAFWADITPFQWYAVCMPVGVGTIIATATFFWSNDA